MIISTIICGGCSRAVQASGVILRESQENPEKVSSLFEFIVAVVIYAVIAATIGAIVAAVCKFVFEKDKDDTENAFFVSAGVIFAICLICYFIF